MKTHYASVALTIAILLLARTASPTIDAQGSRQNSFESPVVYQASGPSNTSVIGTYGNLSYEGAFRAFSQQRLFGSIGDSRTDVRFSFRGATAPAPRPRAPLRVGNVVGLKRCRDAVCL